MHHGSGKLLPEEDGTHGNGGSWNGRGGMLMKGKGGKGGKVRDNDFERGGAGRVNGRGGT